MRPKKNYVAIVILCFSLSLANAQYSLEPAKGFTPQIGIMVEMLENVKDQISKAVSGLDQSEIDYLFDDKANSIGALVLHLAATEAYYQVETLEERAFTTEEAEFWRNASGLGANSKQKGKPVTYYLHLWDQVREKTLEGLRARDDQWLASNIANTDDTINNHWVWFHVLEHQANHMGQIAMVKNRFPE